MKLEKWPGVDSLSVQLRPEILGRVVIETRREDGDRLHTLIRAEDPAVKQLLELRLPELVQRLAEAGIRLDSATVEWSGSEAGGSQHHHQGGKPSPAGRTKTIDTPEPSPLEDVEGVTGAEGLSYFA
ncbi:MAG TPA: flagellar hook-length control protein FliK [Acidobacteriota bacterium]|nr:flagellar hook-length control protein FliK [Acidobacteriota bacterium]